MAYESSLVLGLCHSYNVYVYVYDSRVEQL